ncbi:MAG: cytochrome c biogenesis protein CcdA [bacterium]
MLESIFNWLSNAMNGQFELALVAAFGWGVISIVLSPCHLSSIPLVVGYISSQNSHEMNHPFRISFVFGMGILITIGLIGTITAALGRMMGDVGVWGNLFVAAVFFIVGLYLMDIISINWNSFTPSASLARGWKGALLLGLLFGIGLGPCTFGFMAPVLGVVFNVSATNIIQAISLLAAFGIGHCFVLVLAGGTAGTVQKYLNWTEKTKGATYLKRIAGALVMVAGMYYLYTAL